MRRLLGVQVQDILIVVMRRPETIKLRRYVPASVRRGRDGDSACRPVRKCGCNGLALRLGVGADEQVGREGYVFKVGTHLGEKI